MTKTPFAWLEAAAELLWGIGNYPRWPYPQQPSLTINLSTGANHDDTE